MNEQFSKLLQACIVPADQAEAHAQNTGMIIPNEKLDVAKFAQMIVAECIDQVAGTKIVDPGAQHAQWNNALVIATMNVRDHFGVKE